MVITVIEGAHGAPYSCYFWKARAKYWTVSALTLSGRLLNYRPNPECLNLVTGVHMARQADGVVVVSSRSSYLILSVHSRCFYTYT